MFTQYQFRISIIFWLFILLPGLLTSCIREDLSDCPPSGTTGITETLQIALLFTAELETRTSANTGQAILYIFGSDDRFVQWRTIPNPEFNHPYQLEVQLIPDEYHFIVWFTQGSTYSTTPAIFTPGTHTRADGLLSLDIPTAGNIDFDLPLLLHGKADNQQITGDNQLINIPLVQNTNTIRLTVKGIEAGNDIYAMHITDNNGRYDFDNNFVDHDNFHYTATLGSNMKASRSILRLAAGRHPEFRFLNQTTGQVLYPANDGQEISLTRLIQTAYASRAVDFSAGRTYDIELTFDATDMSVAVTIDGWTVKEQEGSLWS